MAEHELKLEAAPLRRRISVKAVCTAHFYWYPPTFSFSGERHLPMELVYVQSGEVIVSTSRYETPLHPGELIIHGPLEFHRIRANNRQSRVLISTFILTKGSPSAALADRVYATTDFDRACLEKIHRLGSVIASGINGRPPSKEKPIDGDGQMLKCLLEAVLLDVYQSRKETMTPTIRAERSGKKSPLVLEAIEYLEGNLSRKVRLPEVAEAVNYSVPYLESVFKKEMGDSVMGYLVKLRIQKACELISEGDIPLRQVSDALGYGTFQYFSSQFKQVTGYTPTQFKNQSRSNVAHLEIEFEKIANS